MSFVRKRFAGGDLSWIPLGDLIALSRPPIAGFMEKERTGKGQEGRGGLERKGNGWKGKEGVVQC